MAEEETVKTTFEGEDNLSPTLNKINENLLKMQKQFGKVGQAVDKNIQKNRALVAGLARGAQGIAQFTAGARVMTSGLSGAVAGMTTLASGMKNMGLSLHQVTGAFGRAGAAITFAGAGLGVVGAAAAGVAVGFGAMAKSSVGVRREIEDLNISLRVLLRSQERALVAQAQFADFARRSPFQLREVNMAGRQLLAFGFQLENVNDLLEDAGDLAAGMQVPIREVTRALGRLRGGDFGEAFERLRDFGINVREFNPRMFNRGGEFLGTVEEALDLTRQIISERFSGMQAEAAKTFSGMLSMLADHWFQFRNLIAQSGVFDAVKGAIKDLLQTVEELSENGTLSMWAWQIGASVELVLSKFKEIMPGSGTWKDILQFFIDIGQKSLEFIARVIEAVPVLIDTFSLAWKVIKNIFKSLTDQDNGFFIVRWIKAIQEHVVRTLKNMGVFVIRLMDVMAQGIVNILKKYVPLVKNTFENMFSGITTIWEKMVTLPIRASVLSWLRSTLDDIDTLFRGKFSIFSEAIAILDTELAQLEVPDGVGKSFTEVEQIVRKKLNKAIEETRAGIGELSVQDVFGNAAVNQVDNMITLMGDLAASTGDEGLKAEVEALAARWKDIFTRDLSADLVPFKAELDDVIARIQQTVEASIPWWQKLRDAIRDFFIGEDGVFEGVRAGVMSFEREMGTVADAVSSSVSSSLSNVQDTVKEGIGGILFGGDSSSALKKAKKELKDIRDVGDSLLEVFMQQGDSALPTAQRFEFEHLFGRIDTNKLNDKLKEKIGSLRTKALAIDSSADADAFVKSISKVIGQVDEAGSLKSRLKDFGGNLMDDLKFGMEDGVTSALTVPVMDALLWVSEGAWDVVKNVAGSIVNELGLHFTGSKPAGMLEKQLISELGSMTQGQHAIFGKSKGVGENVTKGVSEAFIVDDEMGEELESNLKSGLNSLSSGQHSIYTWSKDVGENVTGGVSDAINANKSMSEGLSGKMKGFLKAMAQPMHEVMALSTALGKGVTGAVKKVFGDDTGMFKALKDKLGGFADALDGPVDQSGQSIAGKIGAKISKGIAAGLGTYLTLEAIEEVFNVTISPKIKIALTSAEIIAGAFDTTLTDMLSSALKSGWNKAFGSGGGQQQSNPVMDGFERSIRDSTSKGLIDGSESAKGNMEAAFSTAFSAALAGGIAFSVANQFAPEGQIGASIGAALGQTFGGPFGAAAAGAFGALIEIQLRNAIGSIGRDLSEAIGDGTDPTDVAGAFTGLDKGGGGGGGFVMIGGEMVQVGSDRYKELTSGQGSQSGGDNSDDGSSSSSNGAGKTVSGGAAGGGGTPGGAFTQVEKALKGYADTKSLSKSVLKGFGWGEVGASMNSMVSKGGPDIRHLGGAFKALIRGNAEGFPTSSAAESWLKAIHGWTVNARTGLRSVPGPDDQAVPAILHGGERVLTASQARDMDSGMGGATVNVSIDARGNNDASSLRALIPEITRAVEQGLRRNSRFGRFSVDNRAVRTQLTN